MKRHLLSLRAFSGIFLGSFLPLGLFPNIVLADGVGDTSVRDTSIRDTSVSNTSISGTSVSDTSVSDLISRGEASGAKVENEALALIDRLRNSASQEPTSVVKVVGTLGSGFGNGLGGPANKAAASSRAKTPPSDLPRKYPKQEALKDIRLPHEGKRKCKGNTSETSAKCPSSLLQGLEAKQALPPSSGAQLLIFVSQSVPESSMKELWGQAQRVGGRLLFRGLVGGSFKETQSYIQELGIVADIDPTKFDEFEVIRVPTFVLSKGDRHDKMVGNISLNAFLEQSGINGDLKEEAAKLYKNLQGGQT